LNYAVQERPRLFDGIKEMALDAHDLEHCLHDAAGKLVLYRDNDLAARGVPKGGKFAALHHPGRRSIGQHQVAQRMDTAVRVICLDLVSVRGCPRKSLE